MQWLQPLVEGVAGSRGVLLEVADVPHLLVGGLLLAVVALQLRKPSGS